jgi:four helix bundle protein
MHDYHKLIIWKRALEFVQLVYRFTKLFPDDERYGLTSQFRRAAVSVLANIVEGRGKPTDKDFLKFLYIAKGSLDECQCYIELALALQYCSSTQSEYIEKKRSEVGYLLYKLIQSLDKKEP